MTRNVHSVSGKVLCCMLFTFLCSLNCISGFAQTKTRINAINATVTDSVLDSVLNLYTKDIDSDVIALIIERYDGVYTYTIFNVDTYDVVIKNPTASYRYWNKHLLLVYSGVEKVINVDSAQAEDFRKNLRPLLPNSHTTRKIKEDLYESVTMTYDPVIWRFKVDNGKILWLRTRINYKSERVLYFDF